MRPTRLSLVFSLAALLSAACSTEADPRPAPSDITAEALSAAQCMYFASAGATQICHRTDSVEPSYVIMKVRERACIAAHTEHEDDYVAVNDPTCGGLGCLPANAPCDDTIGCCDGLTCQSGVCTCTPLTCTSAGVSCGSVSDGCGGTLDCGPCVTCPCTDQIVADQVVWGMSPAVSCIRSAEGGIEGALVDTPVGELGLWGVSDFAGLWCVVQVLHQGPGAQYTSVTPEEYALCKAEVHAEIEARGLTECQLYDPDPCSPQTCEWTCGVIDDGCGGTLDCGPCADCPCSGMDGWADASTQTCATSQDELVAIAYSGVELGKSFGVLRSTEGTLSCFVQPAGGGAAQSVTLTSAEHAACKREVNWNLDQRDLLYRCRPYDYESGCVPTTCAGGPIGCGTILDGCGGQIQCDPCEACPCYTQLAGWGSGPVAVCLRSADALDVEVVVSPSEGTRYGVVGSLADPTCYVKASSGAEAQHLTLSDTEYGACKAQVDAMIRGYNFEQSCVPFQ